MTHAPTETEIAAAERIVMEHVARYRMTTYPAVNSLRGVRHFGRRRLRQLLNSMCRSRQLGRSTLFHQKHYFFLADDGASPTKGAGRRTGPLSETAKVRNYAIQSYCLRGGVYRSRLTKEELASMLPEIDRPGLPLNYYVDTSSDAPRLGFVRVDVGGHGRWDRIAKTCVSDLMSHIGNPAFQQFIQSDAFEVTLITTMPQKADRLRSWIVEQSPEATSLLKVVAFPELINLIAPPPTAN